ncbi:MAG: hypothetical protein U0871_04690 [Gemmataceae bacterium]
MTEAYAFGFEAPRADIPLPVDTGRGVLTLPFLVDTGAAVSLIPIPLADAIDLPYPAERGTDDSPPSTMHGRLTGYRGEFSTRILGHSLMIPCFFYVPPDRPPEAVGPAGHRTVRRAVADLEDWIRAVEAGLWADGADDSPLRRQPCVLGRLGFLNRFRLLIDARDGARHAILSDDPVTPAARRRT